MFTCFAATSRETPLEQTPVTEIQIIQICGEVGEQWRDLGTVLGIAPTSMNDIERDHSASREGFILDADSAANSFYYACYAFLLG